MARTVVLGTRGSPLAMRQAEEVLAVLQRAHPQVQFKLQIVRTEGDIVLDRALPDFGGRGVFVKEMETALLEGRVDAAVHSLKDLPTKVPVGLMLGAVLTREDPRDALILGEDAGGGENIASDATKEAFPGSHPLAGLAAGARLGTGSPRRAAQLKFHRPDLEMVSVRGNVGTRLGKIGNNGLAGIVLAAAGLKRLGLTEQITAYLDTDVCLPAAGQGAITVELRADDGQVRDLVGAIEDRDTRASIEAERALLYTLEGGCHVPIGALGRVEGDVLHLQAVVVEPEGSAALRGELRGALGEPVALGEALAAELLSRGAARLLDGDGLR